MAVRLGGAVRQPPEPRFVRFILSLACLALVLVALLAVPTDSRLGERPADSGAPALREQAEAVADLSWVDPTGLALRPTGTAPRRSEILRERTSRAWAGDHAWGPRYMYVVLPLFALLLAPVVSRVPWRRAVLVAAIVGVASATVGVALDFNQYIAHVSERVTGPPVDGEPAYANALHNEARWSPIVGQPKLLDDAVSRSAADLDRVGQLALPSPFPDTTAQRYFWYFQPARLDAWWLWVFPERLPLWLLVGSRWSRGRGRRRGRPGGGARSRPPGSAPRWARSPSWPGGWSWWSAPSGAQRRRRPPGSPSWPRDSAPPSRTATRSRGGCRRRRGCWRSPREARRDRRRSSSPSCPSAGRGGSR